MYMEYFFSSRRRHTRWPRDWSSDVCSSDLLRDLEDGVPRLLPGGLRFHQVGQGAGHPGGPGPWLRRRLDGRLRHRSEERRVGREARAEGWAGVGGGSGWRQATLRVSTSMMR